MIRHEFVIPRDFGAGQTVSRSSDMMLRMFLYSPIEERSEELEKLAMVLPALFAAIRRSRLVLLRVIEEKTQIMATAVEIGPSHLSGLTDSYKVGADTEDRDARGFAVASLKRVDGMQILDRLEEDPLRENRVFIMSQPPAEVLKAAKDLVDRFRGHLDSRVLSAMTKMQLSSQHDYHWLALSPGTRIQPLLCYPAFARHLIALDRSQALRLSALLDLGGGSLEDFICENLRLTRPVLRHLNRLGFDGITENEINLVDNAPSYVQRKNNIIAALNLLSPEDLPWTREDWEKFRQIDAVALSAVATQIQKDPDGAQARYIALLNSSWRTYRQALKREGQHAFQANHSEIYDSIRSLINELLIPAMIATGHAHRQRVTAHSTTSTYDKLVKALWDIFCGSSIRPLMDFSRAWHDREVADRLSRVGKNTEKFPLMSAAAISERWTSEAGYVYEPLLGEDAIRKEGQEMKHCIASYINKTIKGALFAFRVHGPEGFRATMTLSYCQTSKRFSHHSIELFNNGRGQGPNGENIKPDVQIAAALMEYLNDMGPEITFCRESMRYLELRQGVYALLDNPGYAKEIAERNFLIFLPLLPKRLRAKSPDELLAGPFWKAVRPFMRKTWMAEKAKEEAARKARKTRERKTRQVELLEMSRAA